VKPAAIMLKLLLEELQLLTQHFASLLPFAGNGN